MLQRENAEYIYFLLHDYELDHHHMNWCWKRRHQAQYRQREPVEEILLDCTGEDDKTLGSNGEWKSNCRRRWLVSMALEWNSRKFWTWKSSNWWQHPLKQLVKGTDLYFIFFINYIRCYTNTFFLHTNINMVLKCKYI